MSAVILITARSLLLVAVALIGTVAGVYCSLQGLRSLRRKRLILNTPESKIQNAAMGLVEVSGLAEGPHSMLSPLSRMDCYYYRSVAWQLRRRGTEKYWAKIAEETLHVPFYVDDGSGKVLVDPRGAEIDLESDFQQEYSIPGPEILGCVAEFLNRHGIDPNSGIKVEECCIKPNQHLFVLGTLSQNPGLDATVAPAWARRLRRSSGNGNLESKNAEDAQKPIHVIRLSEPEMTVPATAMTQQQKIAAALSKAGVTNPAAWNSAAGVKVTKPQPAVSSVTVETATDAELQSNIDDSAGFDLHPPVVLMKGTHQPEFFISWRSPREVIKSTDWQSYLLTCGGAMLSLTCIYLILHFHWS